MTAITALRSAVGKEHCAQIPTKGPDCLTDQNGPTDYLVTEPPAQKPDAPTPAPDLRQIH